MTTDRDDTAEILADAETLGRVRTAMREAAAGDVLSEADLRGIVGGPVVTRRRPVLDSGLGVPTNVPTRRKSVFTSCPNEGILGSSTDREGAPLR
jgi:hypothetical protein